MLTDTLCFEDLIYLYKKNKRVIILVTLSISISLFCIIESLPYKYSAKAIFHDSGMGEKSSASGILEQVTKKAAFSGKDLDAQIVMLSRDTLQNVAKKLALQIEIQKPIYFANFFIDCEKPTTAKVKILSATSAILDIEEKHIPITIRKSAKDTIGKSFKVKIFPMLSVINKMKRSLKIKPNVDNPKYLYLKYTHKDAYMAANILNSVMKEYQDYLNKENQRIAKAQLEYLNSRKSELFSQQEKDFASHVSYLKKNIGENGFLYLKQMTEFAQNQKNIYEQLLLKLSTELTDLNTCERLNTYQISNSAISSDMQRFQQDIQKLQQRQAVLEKSIGEKRKNLSVIANIFPKQFTQAPASEVYGMDLDATSQLHYQYNQKLDDAHIHIQQLYRLIKSIHDPAFELSSLSLHVNDRLGNEILQRASHVMQKLREQNHLSEKEIQRLNDDLNREKISLERHFKYMLHVQQDQVDVLSSKIHTLQSIMHELINNELVTIHGQMHRRVQERKASIDSEMKEVQKKMEELKLKLSTIPEKWLMENILTLKSQMNTNILKGMSDLIESKNVQHHLMQVLAKPIEYALPPIKSNKFSKPINAICSFLLAIMISAFTYILRSIVKGFTLHANGLTLAGFDVIGSVGHIKDRHESIHKLCLIDKSLILVMEKPFDTLGQSIAQALKIAGHKTLYVEISMLALEEKQKTIEGKVKGKADHILLYKTPSRALYLQSAAFHEKLSKWKEKYTRIIFSYYGSKENSEILSLKKLVDHSIICIENQTAKDLSTFLQNPERVSFVIA